MININMQMTSEKYTLHEVADKYKEREFLELHIKINNSNPNWIRPLDKDINQVFDPMQNNHLKFGEIIRWLLYDEKGIAIGRIAAFVNKKYKNKGDVIRVGCIGFFDCINEQEAANRLFDTARQWLQQRGMEAMDGPVNFGDRDKWWGLLVSGFHPPLYNMNYNPPYYQQLFESYGFSNFYNQICWSLPVAGQSKQLQDKIYTAHQKFANNPDFRAVHFKKSNLNKFADDFCTIYNKAWAKHESNKQIHKKQAYSLLLAMKPIMDEKLIWFAYHKEEPVAMWVNIPNINQIICHLNGKFNWWGKLKFFMLQHLGYCTKIVGLAYGIVPEFQGTGVDYFMIVEAERFIKKNTKYKDLELQWQGDFNPKMLNISHKLGAEKSRQLITYRCIFDPNIAFQRHPII